MQKKNKIFMGIVSTLLCLTLLSSSLVSGIFAKFAFEKGVDSYVQFKKWGITIEPGSDIKGAILKADANGVMVETGGALEHIAPGTNGCFAWFIVDAVTPEVKFKVDFSGTAEIGDGYAKEYKFVRDANGKPVDYFPIIFYLVAYDYNSTTGKWEVTNTKNVENYVMDFSICHRIKKEGSSDYYTYIDSSPTDRRFSYSPGLSEKSIEKLFNGDDGNEHPEAYLENVFDHICTPDATTGQVASFKRVYTVQWCWPYNPADTSYYKYSKDTVGKAGTYQKTEYDTQLGEAMVKNSDLFGISFDFKMTVEQLPNS